MVADARGRGVYELRAKPDSTEMDSLNVSETGIRALCGADTFLTQLWPAGSSCSADMQCSNVEHFRLSGMVPGDLQ